MPTNEESATDESLDELSDDDNQTEVAPEPVSDAAQTDHFKQKWENQRKVNRDLEAKLKKLSEAAELQGKPDAEREIAERVREAAEAATNKANHRLVAAELRAAAAGKLKNPHIALKLIDISEIDVDADGEVDAESVAAAVDALVAEYPELAVGGGFGGSADLGARGRQTRPAQLSQQELSKLSPAEIDRARIDGRLDALLGKN